MEFTMPATSTVSSSLAPRFTRWAAGLALGLAIVPAAFGQHYAVSELRPPSGYDASAPYQINDQGYIAGTSSRAGDATGSTATVWKNGTVTAIGRLKNGTYSIANAINIKGVVTGEGDDGDGRPLGWVTSGSSLVNFFSNNGGNTRPVAINDAGDIGGYYIKTVIGDTGSWRGAIWKIDAKDARKSTKIDLPLLPGSDPVKDSAIPFAFNRSNEAAGWATNSKIGQHAAYWKGDAAHTIVDLGVYGSDWSSVGNSLNDLGQVVGSSHPPFSSRAIVWQNDAAHTAVELPLLPGDNYGSAQLINKSGVILGYSSYAVPGTWNSTPSRIVIWLSGVPYELQSLLTPAAAASWTISYVASLNNAGQMVGLAMRSGVLQAVLLSPVP